MLDGRSSLNCQFSSRRSIAVCLGSTFKLQSKQQSRAAVHLAHESDVDSNSGRLSFCCCVSIIAPLLSAFASLSMRLSLVASFTATTRCAAWPQLNNRTANTHNSTNSHTPHSCTNRNWLAANHSHVHPNPIPIRHHCKE